MPSCSKDMADFRSPLSAATSGDLSISKCGQGQPLDFGFLPVNFQPSVLDSDSSTDRQKDRRRPRKSIHYAPPLLEAGHKK